MLRIYVPKILRFYCFCCCAIIILCIIIKQQHIPYNTRVALLTTPSYYKHYNNEPLIAYTALLPNPEISAHASALVTKDSKLMALFYAGTREGAEDVKIYQSFLDIKANKSIVWSNARVLLTPDMLTQFSGRLIRKVGNPIVFKDSYGRVHLFVVGVSLGGWATSRIYQLRFSDDLMQIYYVRELHLNPFANYSHLVRTPAMPLENGGFILAFSHEMWHKFPLIGAFDKHGNMLFTRRINNLKAQLQPSIVALNPKDCVALYRTNNRYDTNAYYQTCTDYGKTWHSTQTSNLYNYDSSVLLVNIGNEVILITNDGKHNPLFKNNTQKKDRQSLSLYWLQDKIKGKFIYIDTIDTAPQTGEVSYPAATLSNGVLHITYTYNRKTIKHTAINLQALHHNITFIKQTMMQHDSIQKDNL